MGWGFAQAVCQGEDLRRAGWYPVDIDHENWWTKNGNVAYPLVKAYKKMQKDAHKKTK